MIKIWYLTAQHCIPDIKTHLQSKNVVLLGTTYTIEYFNIDPLGNKKLVYLQDGAVLINPEAEQLVLDITSGNEVNEFSPTPTILINAKQETQDSLIMPTKDNSLWPTIGFEMYDAFYKRVNSVSEMLHYLRPGFSGGALYRKARSPEGKEVKIAQQIVLGVLFHTEIRTNASGKTVETPFTKTAKDGSTLLQKKTCIFYDIETQKLVELIFYSGSNSSGKILIEELEVKVINRFPVVK